MLSHCTHQTSLINFLAVTGGRSFGAYLCILFREGVQGNRGVATRVDVVLTLSKSWEFNMARCPDTVSTAIVSACTWFTLFDIHLVKLMTFGWMCRETKLNLLALGSKTRKGMWQLMSLSTGK